ncbi:hypothetical protein K435DRAFT_869548 [Dendrothele bispora CBS 962.96]|uniref:CxC2-like cysteine cluster KDZ transposase-associated domain-containing protein n=1 Tax=Dendrothele bispora (strain CBS 962.96) TaxID=1314807 RepID=A0A4S8L8X8_DENBC|nr:hypothetical protein K435DRAFT_869548 [Dendrothele bispora CBS 962.96]
MKRRGKATKAEQEKIKRQRVIHGGNTQTQVRRDGSRIVTTLPSPTKTISTPLVSVASQPTSQPRSTSDDLGMFDALPELPPDTVSPDDKAPEPSQSTRALWDLVSHLPELTSYLLSHEHDSDAGSSCSCGRGGKCVVQCQDCLFYNTSCADCFIERHRSMPPHWDPDRGFYRHDISTLREGHAIQLGHDNGICPNALQPIKFVITHSNGVHGTRLSFCGCFTGGNRTKQLMQAHLFPGSAAEPISAFSFSVLKEYDLHTLQAKFGAYDYCFSLRRLTDNIFTHLVNDPYQTFMRVARFWRYMDLRIRVGQEHGISRFFSHRPHGFLMLYCPVCSNPGVNMLGEWWRTPRFLRHLISKRVTFDGNHQANQFWKNTDPFDKSLADGLAYFPETTKYLAFLKSLGHISPEEFAAHCNHVKVIANQGRIQGQNCAKTGVVNTQCDHVFVMATADMQNGERYANVDASSHHAFEMYGFGDDKTDNHRDSHKVKRFASSTYLEDQKGFVTKFEHGIPDLHIKGHIDDCSVVFGHPYHWCVGHFHGETAEYYWVELNQVGGYTRQMKDIVKTPSSPTTMTGIGAKLLTWQIVSLKIFNMRACNIRESVTLSRVPRQETIGRERTPIWVSPYHRRPQATPSLQALLGGLAKVPDEMSKHSVDASILEVFFRKAFDVERLQQEMREIKRRNKKSPETMSISDTEELRGREVRLCKALQELCIRRGEIMPQVTPLVTTASKQTTPETETLFLPSDLTAEDRVRFKLSVIANQEIALRQAQAEEEISKVKTIAKSISSLLQYRTKNIRGQDMKTRSEHQVANAFIKRDRHITAYNHARQALINLGDVDPQDPTSSYPTLRPEDTHRLPVDIKRRTGDSKRRDGLLWTIGAASDLIAGVEPGDDLPIGLDQDLVPVPLVTPTQMTQRVSAPTGPRKKDVSAPKPLRQVLGIDEEDEDAIAAAAGDESTLDARERRILKKEKKYRKDSWLWARGTRSKMSDEELEAWEEEGDRVQWFRAEAEMYRWMEEFELKHAEFERTISHFRAMSSAWKSLAGTNDNLGHVASASRKAAMFTDLAEDALICFRKVGHPDFVDRPDGLILADRVAEWRSCQLSWMKALGIHLAYLDA